MVKSIAYFDGAFKKFQKKFFSSRYSMETADSHNQNQRTVLSAAD